MGCKVGAPLRLSLLLSVPVWCAFLPGAAQAACSTHTPTTGQTVDCTSTDTTGVNAVTNNSTNNTVNVANGASVAVTYTPPVMGTPLQRTGAGSNYLFNTIIVQDNSTVNNAGTISITNNAGTGLRRDFNAVNLQGTQTSLINDGQISATNLDTSNGTGGATARRVYGVISSSPTDGVNYQNVSVVNRGGITVTQGGPGVARGVYAGEGIDSMSIENFGTISVTHNGPTGAISTAGTTIAAVAAIDADDDADDLKVVNHAGATLMTTGASSFTLGGRAQDYDITNAGTITNLGTANGAGLAAILVYGGRPNPTTNPDKTATMVEIENEKTGVVNGNVIIQDTSPFAGGNGAFTAPVATNDTRNSEFTNEGTVNGSFTYGAGKHVLDNSGTITGGITVNQSIENGIAVANGIGAASFTLTNSGKLGGDITINDRSDSVNTINLQGTGFSGNIIAANGLGTNSLTLDGVTNLASVQHFKDLTLNRSNVAVPGGVSLVSNATLKTTVYGPGGTRAAPSTKLGTINGNLNLAGATTLMPTFTTFVRNGDVYQVASSVSGAGANQITVQQRNTALVRTSSVDTSDGRLLLVTNVRNANTVSGLNQPAQATLNALLTYRGNDPQVRALGAIVQNFGSLAGVRAAANALAPITNGADVQSPINAAMLFHQQIDARLDSFVYGQIPSSGRSADLGTPRTVYGVLPTNAAWIEALGGGVHQSTVNQVNGYEAELEGVIGGYDRLITPGFRVGGAFGYINTQVNGNNAVANRETIQTFQGLGYAALEGPRYYLRGSAGYGGVDFQSVRQVNFPGFSDSAAGSRGGNIFTARGEGGVPFEYRFALLVPYAAFTYNRLEQDAFTERSNNGAGFSYRSARNNSERSEAGGKIIVPLVDAPIFSQLFPAGSVVALEARAAYVHEFGNVAQTVAASFAGTGDVFIASGPVPNRDMIDYGVGLRMGTGHVQIDISYNGLARSTYLQQAGLLRARYLF